MYGDVSLQRDSHRHEDGGAHGDELGRVEEVREQDGVQVGRELKISTETLQDRTKQVPRVEADKGDQQQVERIPHLVSKKRN